LASATISGFIFKSYRSEMKQLHTNIERTNSAKIIVKTGG